MEYLQAGVSAEGEQSLQSAYQEVRAQHDAQQEESEACGSSLRNGLGVLRARSASRAACRARVRRNIRTLSATRHTRPSNASARRARAACRVGGDLPLADVRARVPKLRSFSVVDLAPAVFVPLGRGASARSGRAQASPRCGARSSASCGARSGGSCRAGAGRGLGAVQLGQIDIRSAVGFRVIRVGVISSSRRCIGRTPLDALRASPPQHRIYISLSRLLRGFVRISHVGVRLRSGRVRGRSRLSLGGILSGILGGLRGVHVGGLSDLRRSRRGLLGLGLFVGVGARVAAVDRYVDVIVHVIGQLVRRVVEQSVVWARSTDSIGPRAVGLCVVTHATQTILTSTICAGGRSACHRWRTPSTMPRPERPPTAPWPPTRR